jgi:nucleoside-diphosphate-sugar epimerase
LELLKLGYKVRGTVRDLERASWLTDELFSTYVASGSFVIVRVPDLAVEGAFNEAVRGISAIVHVATIVSISPNPNEVIPQTVAGVLNVLSSAIKEPSVERFVYTSTAVTGFMPVPNTKFYVDSNSWNDMAVQIAWAPPPYEPSRGMTVYMASKVEAERAVLQFVKDHKPKFAVNTVNPFTTLGKVLSKNQTGSTTDWIRQLWSGEIDSIKAIPCRKFTKLDSMAWYIFI